MTAKGLTPTTWTTGSTEVFKTGTWRSSVPQYVKAPSPCHMACPVDGNIAEWIGRARLRDFRGAWEILTRNNPFPAVAGRICHHPCEVACNRAGFDESLAICRLERHVGDLAIEHGWSYEPVPTRYTERVAVVGGGPSGLSVAYHLRRRGYPVTIFEASEELGGLMRHGIPAYRLARPVLDAEIRRIVDMGVEVRLGSALGSSASLEALKAQFDIVYLAMGARRQKRLPKLDYEQPWVMDGAQYLARSNAGMPPQLGHRVIVIGGGSAAIDAARSARRAGHDVTILCLERAEQMPAQHEEVAEALEEGIALCAGAMLSEAREHDGSIAVSCVRVDFRAGAVRGEFTLEPIADSAFTLEADALIPSIGQDPDLAPVASLLAADGQLLKVDDKQATSLAGVYAGGDVASMARFVTEAIGMGKRAASEIDRVLRAGDAPDAAPPSPPEGVAAPGNGADEAEPVVPLAQINTFYYAQQARASERRLGVAERLRSDAEVQVGFDLEQALAETERCFSCGTCTFCDNCFHYCPDLAIRRLGDGEGYAVLTDFCKGCGICVRECPTGSMKMVEEQR